MMEKAKRAYALADLVLTMSGRVDLKSIQDKHGFNRKRKARIHLTDCGINTTWQADDGRLRLLSWFPGTPDVEIAIKEICTLKHLRLGYKRGIDPSNGEPAPVVYAPLDAYRFGDVMAYGEASVNDILSFVKVFIDVMVAASAEEVMQIIGPCAHDMDAVGETKAVDLSGFTIITVGNSTKGG